MEMSVLGSSSSRINSREGPENDSMMTKKERNLSRNGQSSCRCFVTRDVRHFRQGSVNRSRQNPLRRKILLISMVMNLICLVAIAYLLVSVIKTKTNRPETEKIDLHPCDPITLQSPQYLDSRSIDLFQDLQLNEIHYVLRFLHIQCPFLNLADDLHVKMTSNFVHSLELYIPEKEEIIKYLDQNGSRPLRKAKVIIFNGSSHRIDEYLVGPITKEFSSMQLHRLKSGISFNFRPVTFIESYEVLLTFKRYTFLHTVLIENYGAALFDCVDPYGKQTCLAPMDVYLPITKDGRRLLWVSFYYDVMYYTQYPIDMQVLMDVTNHEPEFWFIDKVWYSNRLFPSYTDFENEYKNGNLSRVKQPFPTNIQQTFVLKGFQDHDHRDESRSYQTVRTKTGIYMKDQSLEYQGWQFSWLNSLERGISLFNMMFKGERIVYEMGLQEIAILHANKDPLLKHPVLLHGLNGIGSKSVGLVPGVDCPEDAIMRSVTVLTNDFSVGGVLPNALCIFEHKTELPLRRHYSSSSLGGVFYEGLGTNILIFRTIYTINNFNYIIDYKFYENGVMKTSVHNTGFLLNSVQSLFLNNDTNIFGIFSPASQSLFHFKIDLDVSGTNNSYASFHVNKTRDTNGSFQRWTINQVVKQSEKEVTITNDSELYHVIYSTNKTINQARSRGYRLVVQGLTRSILEENGPEKSSTSWSRYPFAVTKYKSTERTSSSPYASFDQLNPIVDFRSFIEDDENIVDEDLVAWVTIGTVQIPRAEDNPNVQTTDSDMSIILSPFNFFSEDPSASSTDAVFMVPTDVTSPRKGLKVKAPRKQFATCSVNNDPFYRLRRDGSSIFFPYS